MQIANEISASYPEIKSIYIGQGNHIDIDSLKVSPCLIVKVKTDTLISESSLEQFKKWIKVRLQTEDVEIDHDYLQSDIDTSELTDSHVVNRQIERQM